MKSLGHDTERNSRHLLKQVVLTVDAKILLRIFHTEHKVMMYLLLHLLNLYKHLYFEEDTKIEG